MSDYINSSTREVLNGFETSSFTGLPYREVADSLNQLITDEFQVQLGSQVGKAEIKKINSLVTKFLDKYYRRMRNLRRPEQVQDLADKSKASQKELSKLISLMIEAVDCPIHKIFFRSSGEGEKNLVDLSEKCPYYIHRNFCLLQVDETMTGFLEPLQFEVPEYRFLALAVLKAACFIAKNCEVKWSEMAQYYMIFEDIIIAGNIFEQMNPTGDVRTKYIDDAITLLEQPHIDYESSIHQEYEQLMYDVFYDIKNTNLPYIRDLKWALKREERNLHSKFDSAHDYYYSMKSSGQKGFTREQFSLKSSAYEVDIHKSNPLVSEFDNLIDYQSGYREDLQGKVPDVTIRTICINNPGKFKPRIIHISDNPIQDRCNYLHNRLQRVLNRLTCDCTSNQDKGRIFLKNLTGEWSTQDEDTRKGLYCTDFSNATDTVDQWFTHKVLEFIFGDEIIANFWDYVSNLPKEVMYTPGNKRIYQQTTGQPQGVLGSFDIFALCHHILFLMDMKQMGMERYKSSDFYRVLGDDAIFCTIEPEQEFNFDYDPNGNRRTELELVHFEKCEHFAGFLINYDKSDSVHHDDNEAKLDFAKVTYRNGKLFSPIPFRLAQAYNKSFDSKFSTVLWRADRGEELTKEWLDFLIQKYIPESEQEIYNDIIKSGQIPFLDVFKDERVYPDNFIKVVQLSYMINIVQKGLAFTIIGDKKKQYGTNFDQFDAAVGKIFSIQEYSKLDDIPTNHKLWDVFESNADIVEALHEITNDIEMDDKILAMCISSMTDHNEEVILNTVLSIAEFYQYLNRPGEIITEIPEWENYRDEADNLKVISMKLMPRGVTKRPAMEAYLFKGIIEQYKFISQQLENRWYVPKIADESSSASVETVF